MSAIAELLLAEDEVIRLFLVRLEVVSAMRDAASSSGEKDEEIGLLDAVCLRAIATDCSPGIKGSTNAL